MYFTLFFLKRAPEKQKHTSEKIKSKKIKERAYFFWPRAWGVPIPGTVREEEEEKQQRGGGGDRSMRGAR
jgi:hypothetical protein